MATVADEIERADREGQLKVSNTGGEIEKALDTCLRVAKAEKRSGGTEYVNALFIGSGGSGKALPNNTPIQIPDGEKPIGEFQIGDKIIGTDGLVYSVTGVFPQGKRKVVKLTFNDKTTAICDLDHIWTFIMNSHGKPTVYTKTISEFMEFFGKSVKRTAWLPVIKPAEYSYKEFRTLPYILGVFLGDGCCTLPEDKEDRDLTLSSGTNEIPDKVANLLGFTTKKNPANYHWKFYKKDGSIVKQSEVLPKEVCGLNSYDKYIPNEYLYGSVEQRIDLLRGLMDTDGSAHPARKNKRRHTTSYSTVSEKLAKQVAYLIRSLGVFTGERTCHRVKTYKGVSKEKTSYQIKFNPIDFNPFYLESKASIFSPATQWLKRILKSIEVLDEEVECTCIEVNSPDHLYLMNDFIPTHNTSRIKAWAKAHNINLKEVHTADLDQTDMGGAVAPDRSGTKVTRLSPTEMNSLDQPNSVLFLDEYNRGMDQIRGTLLTLIENHTVYDGEAEGFRRELKGMLFTIAAINPFSADYNTQLLDAAEESRFMTVYVDSDPMATLSYLKQKFTGRGEEGDEGRLALATAILSSPRFNFSTAEEEARAMSNGNRKPLSARTLTRLLVACDGTKDDFLGLWNRFCDDSKKVMIEGILQKYVDKNDKANDALKKGTDSEVFKKRESLTDKLLGLANS